MKPFSPLGVPLEGVSLVEASAGTGKTYAISTLFVRLLLERGLDVGQILVVTFTEAATAELRDRVRRRLQEAITVSESLERGDDAAQCDPTLVDLLKRQSHLGLARQNLRSALFQFDGAPIFTIHGFCQRVLRENAFATRVTFDAELMQDVRPLVEEVLTDYWLSALSRAPLSLIADLDRGRFTPQYRDLEALSNFVAQATHLELKPEPHPAVPQVHEERVRGAFEEVKRHFDPPTIDTLLRPLYPRADHRSGRERDMKLYLNKPFGAEPLPERCKYFDPAEWKPKKGVTPPSHPFFDAVHRLRQAYVDLQAELDAYRLHIKQQLVAYLRREVANRKAKKGVLSFDDLLQQVHSALMGALGPRLSATLRGRYHAALIDEFQDTDPIQYGIFSTLFVRSAYSNDTGLFLIGDPKQAIYSFRGADVFAYLTAANAVEPDRRFTMGTNYRSDEQLVSAVNSLFLRHPRPFVYEALTYPAVNAKHQGSSRLTPAGPSLDLRFVQRPPDATAPYSRFDIDKLLPERVAEHIVTLLESECGLEGKPLKPSAIAILTRTNREAFDCQRALASRGVPSVVQGDRSVFEQPEAQELQLILAAVVEPSSASAVRTALATELLGMSAEDINTLDTDEDAWDQWVERFRGYQERWREEGFVQMFRQLLLECGITQRLLSSHNGERRMTNVLHLSELLHTEAQAEHLGPSGLLQYLAEQRQRSTTPTESEQVRLESDEDAVVLTTIHKSKGLEYPIVICPFLAGAASFGTSKQWVDFHDEASRDHVLDLGSEEFPEHTSLKLREDLSESLRLLYVALTRAKHRCVVYWGAFGDFHKSAMAELLYGPLDEDASALKKADDATLSAPLLELSRTQPGLCVTLETALTERSTSASAPAVYDRKATSPRSLNARTVVRRVSHWHRTASFTELTRLAPSHSVGLPASDHDELTTDIAADAVSSATDRTLLADFPGGATTGNFFHSILEQMDFSASVSETDVQRSLANHGLPVSLGPLAIAGLRDTLTTPFHRGAALSHIPMSRRLSELAFTLPVTRVLSSRRLAEAFAAEPSKAVSEEYAELIRELPFTALEGFLKGFVDLVFQHEDQWFVVDYKTNDLGDRYVDYSPSALIHGMQHSHYILQYHLYTLALHRYLKLRLPYYDYDQHFGGVYYLFLRGMKPVLGANNGVFFEKPPRRRLELLSAALGDTTP